ncbi:hypothetical protein [Saccharothrix variisporea]|uniref:Tetratricopeptide repeat protein n=1 Tax=Saccharothrix variisporea TaxID=543527 RepID=A0A495XGY4_9PSEU|nr:hypothetical protein [Saccharothrix variisporea]RKT73731.1 hypothetical protein DFJ66_7068 [Saccharothrix variisporea]
MRRRVVWLLIGLALVLVAVGAVVAKLAVPAVVSSAVAAAAAVVAGFSTTRAAAVMKLRDDRRDARQSLLRCDRRGRLPLVRDLDDPVQLGTHPAAVVGSNRVPAFVRRDVSARLEEAISADRFVLLVGESTAGKSRLAYEVVRALLPDHRLVEPAGRDAAGAAVEAVLDSPRAVLWLDDVERFLGEGGFTGAGISAVLSARRHVVLATMRSEEYSYFRGGSSAVADATRSRETARRGWEVLRLATRIDLPRTWSAEEVRRARSTGSHDPRLAEALEQVDRFGVAEYLAAGPQLLTAWRDAWAPGTHPRAAALVLAAVDARRAGIHRPVDLDVLVRAHESYLRGRGGHRLRPEPVEEALDWATTPLHATSSLLIPHGDGQFLAFDYLIDAIDRVAIPEAALEAFVDGAQPGELRDIGQVAWQWGRLDQAELAYERASATWAEYRTDRGYVIAERDGRAAQSEYLHRSVDELTAQVGWDHEDTIGVRAGIAWDAGYGHDLRLSLRALHRLLPEAEASLGAFHPTTLNIRRGIAHWTGEIGETRRAATLYQRLVDDCLEHLDDQQWVTYASVLGYVAVVERGTTPGRAVELYDEVGAWMAARRAPADFVQTLRYQRTRQLGRAGRYDLALAEWESIVADEERRNGRFATRTLSAHQEWLSCTADSGDLGGALRAGRRLLDECVANGDVSGAALRALRFWISVWTGESGDVAEAVRVLRAIREEDVRRLGEDDPTVWAVDLRLRFWSAVDRGRVRDAADELRRLHDDVVWAFGVSTTLAEKVLRELEKTC